MGRTDLYEGAIRRFEEIWPDANNRVVELSSVLPLHVALENSFIDEGAMEDDPGDLGERWGKNIHRTLVYSRGQGLFSGEHGHLIRKHVLQTLVDPEFENTEETRRRVFADYCRMYDELPEDTTYEDIIENANPGRWEARGPSAKRFCRLTGFDEFFAGEKTEPPIGHYDNLPWVVYPSMRSYQEEISKLMMDVLESDDPGQRQGIMVMPTGAGKTRVAVETLLKWYLSMKDPPLIVWLCHRNELCSQASGSFESVWKRISIDGTENPHERSLRVYRFWDNIWTDENEGQQVNRIDRGKGGVAIVSIQTLQRITMEETEHHSAVRERLMDPECIIVDEVHRFESTGYRTALSRIGVDVALRADFKETRIGLTATPWRSDADEEKRMYARWGNRFLLKGLVGQASEPDQVEQELDDLRTELQDEKILAKPNYYTLTLPNSSGRVNVDRYNELTVASRLRLAGSKDRNKALMDTIEWLIKRRGRKSILVFGITKEHAKLMSVALYMRDVPSASVDADTPSGERRSIIAKFRSGEFQVLCNHSIFTTGFDAPKTDAILICRPIRSKTLLDQIFGRGLRGPEFGGTADCDIIVPDDRFQFTNGQTRRLETYAVPRDEIEKMLGSEVEQVPEDE